MRTSHQFSLLHVFAAVFSLALLFAAYRLGPAAVVLAPVLVPLFILGLGVLMSARYERHASERAFLYLYGVALLAFLACVIGGLQWLLRGG